MGVSEDPEETEFEGEREQENCTSGGGEDYNGHHQQRGVRGQTRGGTDRREGLRMEQVMDRTEDDGKELKMAFKNVRRIRGIQKQQELVMALEREKFDVCGVVETALSDDEYLEGGKRYKWFGRNREEPKGGVGFLVRKELECEVLLEEEDVIAICVIGKKRMNLICVYQRCQGVDEMNNRKRTEEIRRLIGSLPIQEPLYIGGDFNGHIWEMGADQNTNGEIMKDLAVSSKLDILNVIWPGLAGITWEQGDRSHCLDYVLVNCTGLRYIKTAWLSQVCHLVESDHKAICLVIKWKFSEKRRKKRKTDLRIKEAQIEQYQVQVRERLLRDEETSLQEVMLDVTKEMLSGRNNREEHWSREWWDDEVREAVERRKEYCRLYRYKRKEFRVTSETEHEVVNRPRELYEDAKE